jgi:hypothetical protein
LINWTILSTQARQHLRQFIAYSKHLLFAAPVFYACFLNIYTIICKNCTTAKIKDPNAKLPKWNRKAIFKLLLTGESRTSLAPWLKYHIQHADATVKIPIAPIRALDQRVPNIK